MLEGNLYMRKKYVYVLVTYIAMQLSVFIGMPLVYMIGTKGFSVNPEDMKILATVIWLMLSFIAGLLIILLILRKKEKYTRLEQDEPMPIGKSIVWAIGGIFLAFIAQAIAISVEQAIGIEPGSENTKDILNLIELFPIIIVISSIIGPILEEIVFRKVIFGTFYHRFPFWISALISSIFFSIAHMDFEHFLLYAAMGFVFAFLYVKTKRIIVPIIAHVMMNTLVVVMQYFLADKIQKYLEEAERMQGWIGGWFL